MAKREVKTDKIRTPSGVFSQATVIEAQGKLVFISGMTARKPDGTIAGIGDITAQTRQVCENVKSAVEAAGGTLACVMIDQVVCIVETKHTILSAPPCLRPCSRNQITNRTAWHGWCCAGVGATGTRLPRRNDL